MSPARWNTPQNRRFLVRFLLVGVGSTLVDFTAYLLLTLVAGAPESLAKALGYLSGMAPGFLGNKLWTFGSKRRAFSEPAVYVALNATTLLVNVSVHASALAVFGRGLPIKIGAFVAAAGTTTMLNFLGLRLIAFRRGIQEAELRAVEPAPRLQDAA